MAPVVLPAAPTPKPDDAVAEFWRSRANARNRRLKPIRDGEFPVPANEFPVRSKKFPAFGGTGNWGKLLDLLGICSQNGPERPGIVRKFQEFPVIFPVFREWGSSLSGRHTKDIKHILFFDAAYRI